MNSPTLEQLAYRWRNGDSLPGVNDEAIVDGASAIIREANQQVDFQRTQEDERLKQIRLNLID